MRNWSRFVFVSVIGFGFTGCDSSSSTAIRLPAALPSATPSEVDSEKALPKSEVVMLDHPEYANWSQFPVGTSVTRKRLVTNEFGEVKVATRLWLEEKSDKEVTVGSQVTVERPNQPIEVNPDSFTKYVAQFQLPAGMPPDAFLLPSNKAKRTGDEPQMVDGRNFNTEVYEWQESNETGPMTVKLWRCNEFPGRIMRQEMLTVSSSTRTIEEIAALEVPAKMPESDHKSSETENP